MKKSKDPYPIVNTYHVAYNLVDAATVTVTDLFSNKFLGKLKKRQSEYYLNCKKLNKYKSIDSPYSLQGNEWTKYCALGTKVGYGYFGQSAEVILKERKKKNETTN